MAIVNPNMLYPDQSLGASQGFNEAVPYTPTSDDWFSQNAPPTPNTGGVTGNGSPVGGGGVQGDAAYDAFGRGLLATGGKTVDDLKNYVQQWNAQNPNAQVTLGGSKGDKVYGPGGEYWQDAVISAGTGGTGFNWGPKGGDSGGQAGALGSLTAPYGGQFSLMSPEQFLASPFAQASLNAIRQGGERGAAARGTLLTPGTEQAINQKQLDYLGDSYAQMANMDLGVQQGNYGIFKDNQDRPFDKLYATSQLGLGAVNGAANNASAYSTNAQNNATDIGSAQANGTVAGNNVTTGALGSVADTGLSAYNKWLNSRKVA